MARARATCTCKVCGKQFEKTAKVYNMAAAFEWEKWAEENITLCPSCWGKQKRQEEIAKGFRCEVRKSYDTTTIVFYGDTYLHKEELKALGAKWDDFEPIKLDTDRALVPHSFKRWGIKYKNSEMPQDKIDELFSRIAEIGCEISTK